MELVALILFAVSLILFFGFFAEFIFRKLNIPDVLFLIILGIAIGPHGLNYATPEKLLGIAPVFTTFALLFLLFDGAFNINLVTLIREFSQSFVLTIYNFLISSIVITLIVWGFGYFFGGISFLASLLTGFLLGGVSSAFVIPVLKQMNVGPKIYSLLALESALTDVFCIVFSLTVIEIFNLGDIIIRDMLTQLASLFAIAMLIGLLGGIIWIILTVRVFEEHNYMMTIAYLLLIYVATEFLHGNGAIAALFFGLILKNSKQLSSIIRGILSREAKEKEKALQGELGISVTTVSEEFFYHQVSFFLKTFFFVYIGILLDISDWKAITVGITLSIVLMISRRASSLLTKSMGLENRSLVNSIFARGLAAAAIAQLALLSNFPYADFIVKVAYITITGTIVLSSISVFFVRRQMVATDKVAARTAGKEKKSFKSKVKKVKKK